MASSAFHLAANETSTLLDAAGSLDRVVINSRGLASTATVYDSPTASGTIIAVIDTTVPGVYEYDVSVAALTIVTAGTAPADLTVVIN